MFRIIIYFLCAVESHFPTDIQKYHQEATTKISIVITLSGAPFLFPIFCCVGVVLWYQQVAAGKKSASKLIARRRRLISNITVSRTLRVFALVLIGARHNGCHIAQNWSTHLHTRRRRVCATPLPPPHVILRPALANAPAFISAPISARGRIQLCVLLLWLGYWLANLLPWATYDCRPPDPLLHIVFRISRRSQRAKSQQPSVTICTPLIAERANKWKSHRH